MEKDKTKITKAVIPAAGLGTRLYPISQAIPKEMFPLGNRSTIEYVIHEGLLSGFTHFCFIISPGKEVIRSYLTKIFQERDFIEYEGCSKELEVHFISQSKPTGLGDAILLAREFTCDDNFAILLPDNLYPDMPPATAQMITTFNKHGCPVLGASEIPIEHEEMFEGSGRFEYETLNDETELRITKIYDKSVKIKKSVRGERFKYRGRGRYIFTKSIFHHLEKMRPQDPEDYDEIPAVQSLLEEEMMIAKVIKGRTFDCGTPEGFRHTVANLGFPE